MSLEHAENLSNQYVPTDSQRKIFEYLKQISKDYPLDVIYYGSLQAYNNLSLSNRHALAAHGFRELIEKLSLTLSSINIDPNDLKNRAQELLKQYRKVNPTVDSPEYCLDCKKWFHGEKSTSFLESAGDFFNWFDTHPTAIDRYKDVVRALDPAELSIPEETLDLCSREFQKLYKYFATVSHHRATNLTDFDGNVVVLERILISYFYPPTFQKHDELNRIINEAEANDH